MTAPPPWAGVAARLGVQLTVGERVLAYPREDRRTRTVWVFGPGVYAGVFPRPRARMPRGPDDLVDRDLELAAEHLRSADAPEALARERAARLKDGDDRARITAWERAGAAEWARPWRDRVVENALWTAWWTALFPRIDLDDGQVAWSLQCWFTPLDEAEAMFAGHRVVVSPVPPMPPPPPFPRERQWLRP